MRWCDSSSAGACSRPDRGRALSSRVMHPASSRQSLPLGDASMPWDSGATEVKPSTASASAIGPLRTVGSPFSCVASRVKGGARQANTTASRQAAPGGSDLRGGEERRFEAGARKRASSTDSPKLFERSERSERSEFFGAASSRAPQRSRSAAKTAPVGAPAGRRLPRCAERTSAKVRFGPVADGRPVHCGSREAWRSN
jgi:hypothetical protein